MVRSLCSNTPRLPLLWFRFHTLPGLGKPAVSAAREGALPQSLLHISLAHLLESPSALSTPNILQAEIRLSHGVIVAQDLTRQQLRAPCQGYFHHTVPLRSTAAWSLQ